MAKDINALIAGCSKMSAALGGTSLVSIDPNVRPGERFSKSSRVGDGETFALKFTAYCGETSSPGESVQDALDGLSQRLETMILNNATLLSNEAARLTSSVPVE